MKINFNMAIGFVKRFLLKILLENDENRKTKKKLNTFVQNVNRKK